MFGIMAFMSLIAAGLGIARRFARQGWPAWAWYSAASGVSAFAVTSLPWSPETASPRFAAAAAAVIISGWLAAISWRLRAAGSGGP